MSPATRTSLARAPRRPAVALGADETGATAVEYALIAALVSVAIIGALKALGADMAALPLQAIIDALRSVL